VRGASITERVFLGLTAILLVGAFYKTWLEKHHEVVGLEAALREARNTDALMKIKTARLAL
jgi:hypothetical protein